MLYTSVHTPLPSEVIYADHKKAVIDRIVESFYTNHTLRACVVNACASIPRQYDVRHGLPNGYVYELADADLYDLKNAFEMNGIWTAAGLDAETKQRHAEELSALHEMVQREFEQADIQF